MYPSHTIAVFFVLFVLSPLLGSLYAGAKAEEEKPPQNNEWTLCITVFDVSALPDSQKIMGEIAAKDLASALSNAGRRYRSGGETAFYEDYARTKARQTAAKALAAKRNERDILLYQGSAGWKYKKDLKAKTDEIALLEEDLEKVDAEIPEINGEPVFKLTEENAGGAWPAPPARGAEYRFCASQKADGFITGALSEFHGRVYLNLKMYTLHTRSFSYEDSVIFSSDDTEAAFEELSDRVFAAALGVAPAVLTVRAEPDSAVIIVDGSYAGRGEAAAKGRTPGEVEVEVSAEGHESKSFPVELNSGEIAELYVNLSPISRSAFTVEVPGIPGSSVYSGSLYLGTTPLLVEFPAADSAYISVETPAGEAGAAIFEGGRVVRGSAQFLGGDQNTASYATAFPVDPKEERVEKARRRFYGAYGRFWLALPLSMVAIGMADNYVNAYNHSPSQDMYNSALDATYVKYVAFGLIGITAVELVIRIARYLTISGSDAEPLAQFPEEETETEETEGAE